MNKIYKGFKSKHNRRNVIPHFVLPIILLIFLKIEVFAGDDAGKLKVVVIDPGHGGEDPGALGIRTKEKDVVLGIGLKLGKLINENLQDVKIIFTRNDDKFIPLHERAEIATRNNADLFISIHANANRNHNIYGTETYAMGLHTNEKNLEVAKKENAVITFEKDYSTHYEGYDPNSSESFIIFTLMQNTYLEQSLEFADIIQDKFEKNALRYSRGVKQAGFLVLWKTTMPSILIETGYITNPEEEKFLSSDEGQMKIAQSIYNAFTEYKKRIESKSEFQKGFIVNNSKNENKVYDTNSSNIENDSIIFKIQILSSVKPIPVNSTTFNKCSKIEGEPNVEEFFSNNNYKYLIGGKREYTEIVDFNKKVRVYYPKSFIIAVKNGKIIPLSSVVKKINN